MLEELGKRVKAKEITWQEATDLFNKSMGEEITSNALRVRYFRLNNKPTEVKEEYKTIYGDGTIEAQTIVNLPREIKDNPNKVLDYIGYNSQEWEILSMTFSNWQQHTKMQNTKELYAIKFRIKPRVKETSVDDLFQVVDKAFKGKITPLRLREQKPNKELDENKFMLLGAVELHLGKEARTFDVGEEYNIAIAVQRYEEIVRHIIEEQNHKRAGKLIYGIGNDFFNVDTPMNTTTKGTPQLGGISSYELFDIGLKLQVKALLTLREHFNEIELVLVRGNHANTLEYALYRAIQERFIEDNIVSARDDYKPIQAIKEGNTSVFMTHGDKDYKRTIETMSKEFYKIYGDTEFRYIILGHLHHLKVEDKLNGFTVIRLSSPSGIDRWHYNERYLGQARQEIFTFNKETGLENTKYLTFQKVLK